MSDFKLEQENFYDAKCAPICARERFNKKRSNTCAKEEIGSQLAKIKFDQQTKTYMPRSKMRADSRTATCSF